MTAPPRDPALAKRLRLLAGVLLALLAVLLFALARLQLVRTAEFSAKADRQNLRRVSIAAPRGALLDREGRVLAHDVNSRRVYPHDALAAHALGRVRRERLRPSTDAIRTLPTDTLSGDFGLEKHLDARLRCQPGEQLLRIDAGGEITGAPLARTEPTPGETVTLTLDLDLQRAAERAMDATPGTPRGAAVALDVRTGEVLVLASRPAFDLNAVSPAPSVALKARLDATGAWLNRATQGLYPPGSSFKIFTALAAFRKGILRADTVFTCNGYLDIAGRRFTCHQPEGHGPLSFTRALAQSCNVFHYHIGLGAGPEALADEARRFHLHAPTGIELPGETTRMLVPDPGWKTKTYPTLGAWSPGDTANLAIGQGFLRITPLQTACAMASLARRETRTVPRLLRPTSENPTANRSPEPLGVYDADYAALLAGLRAVVESGIGRDAQVPGLTIAGKTGTAQIERAEDRFNVAWFLAFAPVENPRIAIAVAMESDTPNVEFAGAKHASPIVREILAAWFGKQNR